MAPLPLPASPPAASPQTPVPRGKTLGSAPNVARNVAGTFPPTPDSEPHQLPQPTCLADGTQQIPKIPNTKPKRASKPMTAFSISWPQTPDSAGPNTQPQVAVTKPRTTQPPTQEPCDVGDPMDISSPIYDMSPGRSIHESPEMAEFVLSCVPKNSEPLPAWELYFNKNLANTISAFSSASCRFEHPGANRQNANPFSALSGGGNSNRGAFGGPATSAPATYSLNKDTIYKDLTEERPSWILSAYGPGRDAPEQLWGGYPIEQSFEEARLHFMMGQMAGNPQGALNDIQTLENQVQQKIHTALQNLDGAINFVVQAQNNHPNRQDICQAGTTPTTGEFAVGKRPVGLQTGGLNSNPFGQSPAPAQQANPFSSGGGGGTTSAFGQTSTMGQPSAFGQTSALGSTNAFGQPSTLGSNTGFGQTSALGSKPSPFGQPSALGSSSPFAQAAASGGGFGQTSALGQKPSPFGATSMQPAQSSGFGQPAQPSGFGQPSALGAKPNPFAAAASGASASPFSAFANNNNTANNAAPQSRSSPFSALGGTATNNNAGGFGNPLQTNSNPFGQPQQTTSNEISMDSAPASTINSFANAGNTNAAPNPFGQPAQPAAAANPFAQASAAPTPFGAPAMQQQQQQQQPAAAPAPATGISNPYGPNATRSHPDYNSYAAKSPTGQLLSWNGKPITYKQIDNGQVPGIQNFDGSWTKIWFPDGPPTYNKDTEPTSPYTDEEKTLYNQFINTGKFQLAAFGGGGVPLHAPMREMCTWNF